MSTSSLLATRERTRWSQRLPLYLEEVEQSIWPQLTPEQINLLEKIGRFRKAVTGETTPLRRISWSLSIGPASLVPGAAPAFSSESAVVTGQRKFPDA